MRPEILDSALRDAEAVCACHHMANTHDDTGLCRMNRDYCGCRGFRLMRLLNPAPPYPWKSTTVFPQA